MNHLQSGSRLVFVWSLCSSPTFLSQLRSRLLQSLVEITVDQNQRSGEVSSIHYYVTDSRFTVHLHISFPIVQQERKSHLFLLLDSRYTSCSISFDLFKWNLAFTPFGTEIAQSTSPMPPSITGTSETCKRKRDDDSSGPSPNQDPNSHLNKRQKYIKARNNREHFPRNGSMDDNSNGEERSRPLWAHPLVCSTVYANDMTTDKLHSQSHQPALCTNITQASKLSTGPTLSKAPAPYSSASSNVAFSSETTKESKLAQKDTVNVSDRKRHFMYNPTDAMTGKMKKYVHDFYRLFDGMRSENCWLHPCPPAPCRNGRPRGTIQCGFVWKDASGDHKLKVNFGFVALIVRNQITEEQMKGYVKESWHLSHLCGNWTCCNWRHMTVESGRINNSRNQCFPSHGHCSHKPQCMKHRKRLFLVTVDISNHIKSAIKSVSSDGTATAGYQSSDFTAAGLYCGICGNLTFLCGSQEICHSLTSISKCQETLKNLEMCTKRSNEVCEAIGYLREIIKDLSREKTAS